MLSRNIVVTLHRVFTAFILMPWHKYLDLYKVRQNVQTQLPHLAD